TDLRERGATVQMNFHDRAGVRIDCYEAERRASAERISLRAGCHCNPGAREAALHYTSRDLEPCFDNADRISYEEFQQQIEGKTTGALRLSIGLATNFADISRFLEFAGLFVDCAVTGSAIGAAPRPHPPSPAPS